MKTFQFPRYIEYEFRGQVFSSMMRCRQTISSFFELGINHANGEQPMRS